MNISNSAVSLFLGFSGLYCSLFVIELVYCSICTLA